MKAKCFKVNLTSIKDIITLEEVINEFLKSVEDEVYNITMIPYGDGEMALTVIYEQPEEVDENIEEDIEKDIEADIDEDIDEDIGEDKDDDEMEEELKEGSKRKRR